MRIPKKGALLALAFVGVGAVADDTSWWSTSLTGRKSLSVKPDLAAISFRIEVGCFGNQLEAQSKLHEAVHAVARKLEGFKAKGSWDFVAKYVSPLTQENPTKSIVDGSKRVDDVDENNKKIVRDVPTPREQIITACKESWYGSAVVSLITHRTKELGQVKSAVDTEVRDRNLNRDAENEETQNTVSIKQQRKDFWLTDEGRKPLEKIARDAAWKHLRAQATDLLTNKQCPIAEAYVAQISEGGFLSMPHHAMAVPMAPQTASFAAAPESVSARRPVDVVKIDEKGQRVEAEISVSYNIRSGTHCKPEPKG
jgi:hypothetical protein